VSGKRTADEGPLVKRIRVLALATYPVAAASTRYRIAQFIEPLRRRQIDIEFASQLDDELFASLYKPRQLRRRLPRLAARTAAHLLDAFRSLEADAVFIQREAMLFGPPLIEWLMTRRLPMILDLDDATWMSFPSPVYGRLASVLKHPSKTNQLIDWASRVTCGSPNIARYVQSRGGRAVVIPTVVDTAKFRPRDGRCGGDVMTIGWIGTHTTYPFLRTLFPLFERLARECPFRLLVVGSGEDRIDIPGLEVINRPWQLDREIADFQSIDIGVYPLGSDEWSLYKAGFKAVQYMAFALPFVMTPAGVCATIGTSGRTHLTADSGDAWYRALKMLLTDETLRQNIGAAGRDHAVQNYDLEGAATTLASVITEVTE